jgi:hypothetical protein
MVIDPMQHAKCRYKQVNSCSGDQRISVLLWNTKIYCRHHKVLSSNPMLSDWGAVNILTPYVSIIHFTISLPSWPTPRPRKACLSMKRHNQYVACISCFPTERRCRVVNTPASYLGDPGFKSGSRDRLSCLRFFVVFLSHGRMPGHCLKISPRTASFQIRSNSSVTYHPFIQRYIVLVTERAS